MIGAVRGPRRLDRGTRMRICHDYIVERSAGHPGATRLSRLSEVDLHLGQPRRLPRHSEPGRSPPQAGRDVVNIDVTVIKNGFHGDSSRMYAVGQASLRPHVQRLVDVTLPGDVARHSAQVRPGARLGDIGAAIQHVRRAAASCTPWCASTAATASGADLPRRPAGTALRHERGTGTGAAPPA